MPLASAVTVSSRGRPTLTSRFAMVGRDGRRGNVRFPEWPEHIVPLDLVSLRRVSTIVPDSGRGCQPTHQTACLGAASPKNPSEESESHLLVIGTRF